MGFFGWHDCEGSLLALVERLGILRSGCSGRERV